MRRVEPSLVWSAALVGGAVPVLAALPMLLRAVHLGVPGQIWSRWPITPGIVLPVLLVLWLYLNGRRQALHGVERHMAWRHLAFFGGLAVVFLALQSPIEVLSDHIFVAHQAEHMLLRTVGPLLLVAAAPQAALLRGLPPGIRQGVVAPVLARAAGSALGHLARPVPATALFVGMTYFWMIPRYHDLALLDEPVHELWHASLLAGGLIFFWRLLDPRPHPLGASLGARLGMFCVAALGNILLGFFLAFKHTVLYSAYDVAGRLAPISPAADERFGGLTMWIPGSMMLAAAALLMIGGWARREERADARRRAVHPASAATASLQRAANRKLAIGLLAFVTGVLALTFGVAFAYRYSAILPAFSHR
jgi:putative membrane protein